MPTPPPAPHAQRILVVASESVCADDLRQAVGDGAQDAEVLVVAPALQTSALRFWMSDADAAIKRASAVQHNSDGLLNDLQARFDVPVQTHIVTS